MTGIDPFEAFVLGVVVTLGVGYLWLRWRWTRPPSVGQGPPAGSLVDNPPPPPPAAVAPPAAPAPASPATSNGPARTDLRLSERVILHLDRYDHSQIQELAPFMLCQQGMVEKLAVRQSALTKVLQRLIAAGAVVETTEHVQGQGRRLRVYRLTTLGHLLAKDLRSRAGGASTPPRST